MDVPESMSRRSVRRIKENWVEVGKTVDLKRECIPLNARGIFSNFFFKHGFEKDNKIVILTKFYEKYGKYVYIFYLWLSPFLIFEFFSFLFVFF